MKTGFDKAAQRHERALDAAFARIDKVVGMPDEDMIFYEHLQPDELEAIRQHYGDVVLQTYIKDMELKRLKEGGNG